MDKSFHREPPASGIFSGNFIVDVGQDIRYSLRMLSKSPGFAAVAILTLALGIGANAATFSLFDAVMLRSIPVRDPQSLVVFQWSARSRPQFQRYTNFGDCGPRPGGWRGGCSLSVPFFNSVRAQQNTFSGLTAFFGPMQLDLSGDGPATLARGEFVSGEFFQTRGVSTILGRPLEPTDDSPKASLAIVLSYRYWQSAFGGDRSAVGRTVRVNNVPVEIVGVTSPKFTNLASGKTQDFFLPFSAFQQMKGAWFGARTILHDAYDWGVVIVGRLRPGIPIGQSQAATSTIFRNEMLHGANPLSKAADDPQISLLPVNDGLVGPRWRYASRLYVVIIAVGVVLLVACANVAGLMLVRSATRQKEIGVRLALGAGRARIVQQLLTESVILSILGGALGVLLAIWGIHAITAFLTSGSDHPFPFVVAPDWRVVAFTIGITFISGILFGLAPAFHGTRVDLMPVLKQTASSSTSGMMYPERWLRLGDALVVTQVALSILVLAGAGLFLRTLENLRKINPGFDTQNILLFGLDPTVIGYKDAQSAELFRDLRDRFAALPGVISASYSSDALLAGSLRKQDIHLDGTPPYQAVMVDSIAVGINFFSTLHIPMVAGGEFTSVDFAEAAVTSAAEEAAWEASHTTRGRASLSPRTATLKPFTPALAPVPILINKAFAQKYFPKEDPVGKHIGDYESRDAPAWIPRPGYVVLGVVGDTKYRDLRSKIDPIMYVPFTGGGAHFELRTASNPAALISAARRLVAKADKNLPLFDVRTQTEQIENLLVQERMMAHVSSFFALLALVLACMGLYGLLSYEVTRRTREIGIRMALGAQQRDVLKLVVGRGVVLAILGDAGGIGIALSVARYLSSMLYDLHANDPGTMITVAILLALVALVACYIPARRAMKVDPIIALRYE